MKTNRILLIVFLLLSMAILGHGQRASWSSDQLDSLRLVSLDDNAKSDSLRFNAFEQLIVHFASKQIDSMQLWSEKAISAASNSAYQKARFINFLAKSYFLRFDFPQARANYSLAMESDTTSSNRAKSLAGFGLTYLYGVNNDSLVYYCLKADSIFHEIRDTINQINNLYTLFQSQIQLSNLKGSRSYLDRANFLVNESDAEIFYANNSMNYGVYFMTQFDKAVKADTVLRSVSLDSAYYHFQKSYEIHEANGLEKYMAIAKYNMGLINERAEKWNAALKDYKEGRALVLDYNDPNTIRRFDGQILSMLIHLGDAKKVIPMLNENVEYYKEKKNYQGLYDTYLELSNAYAKLGNWKLAYDYKNVQLNTKLETIDSLTINKVAELETKYQAAQKDKQIAEQELALTQSASRSRLLGTGVVAALVISGLLLWFTQRQSKIQSVLQKAEIQTLKQENKLIAMQGILSGQEEERKRIAQDLHDNIGTLMTTIKMKVLDIQKSIADVAQINIAGEIDEMIGQASSEIRRISHNMTPVAMDLTGLVGAIEDLSAQLQANGIQSTIEMNGLDQIKDKQKEVIIYRIIQELVNNIGKHANARNVQLRSAVDGKTLVIEISDDGDGMDKAQWNNGNGLGVKSIKSRVEYLEGTIKMKNDNGTHFKIQIPI